LREFISCGPIDDFDIGWYGELFVKIIAVLVLSLLIAGCSTTNGKPYTPPPPPPEGKSLVYVMRSQAVYGSAYETVFSINDSAVAAMKDKGYAWFYISPGLHKFSAGPRPNPENVKIPVLIESGQEYYIEYRQESQAYQSYIEIIKKLEPSVGKAMIKHYKYAKAN
jgi:hypothetical protein